VRLLRGTLEQHSLAVERSVKVKTHKQVAAKRLTESSEPDESQSASVHRRSRARVFFRSQTAYQAENLHVSGWVHNREDGRVEAVFEGEKGDVERLVEFCRRGPSGARVENAVVEWEKYTGKFVSFEIRS
jgi:acylphosphatase